MPGGTPSWAVNYPVTNLPALPNPLLPRSPTRPLSACNLFCLLTLVETYSKVSQPPKNLSQIEVCQDSRLYAFAFW
jgi:hypothetical protein